MREEARSPPRARHSGRAKRRKKRTLNRCETDAGSRPFHLPARYAFESSRKVIYTWYVATFTCYTFHPRNLDANHHTTNTYQYLVPGKVLVTNTYLTGIPSLVYGLMICYPLQHNAYDIAAKRRKERTCPHNGQLGNSARAEVSRRQLHPGERKHYTTAVYTEIPASHECVRAASSRFGGDGRHRAIEIYPKNMLVL